MDNYCFTTNHIKFVYKYYTVMEGSVDVVESVTRTVNKKRDFFGAFYTASVKSGVQDVIQLLKQSRCPLLLGMWGMAGIGKSTIAEAIYN